MNFIMLFTVNICFGKKGSGCSSLKMRIKILFFFNVVVKRRNKSSDTHRVRTDNEVIEDHQLIKDNILDFYKNLYAESVSNDHDIGNVKDFIGNYILELVSS